MSNLRCSSGHQQVVSRRAVVSGAKVHEEKNDDNEHLCSFSNTNYVDTYYIFIEYRARNSKNRVVEESIMYLACFDDWVADVLTCLEQLVARGGHRQKLYRDT